MMWKTRAVQLLTALQLTAVNPFANNSPNPSDIKFGDPISQVDTPNEIAEKMNWQRLVELGKIDIQGKGFFNTDGTIKDYYTVNGIGQTINDILAHPKHGQRLLDALDKQPLIISNRTQDSYYSPEKNAVFIETKGIEDFNYINTELNRTLPISKSRFLAHEIGHHIHAVEAPTHMHIHDELSVNHGQGFANDEIGTVAFANEIMAIRGEPERSSYLLSFANKGDKELAANSLYQTPDQKYEDLIGKKISELPNSLETQPNFLGNFAKEATNQNPDKYFEILIGNAIGEYQKLVDTHGNEEQKTNFTSFVENEYPQLVEENKANFLVGLMKNKKLEEGQVPVEDSIHIADIAKQLKHVKIEFLQNDSGCNDITVTPALDRKITKTEDICFKR